MKLLHLLLVILTAQLLVKCNRKQANDPDLTVTEHVEFTETVYDVGPPPPGLKSKSKTVQEWLNNLSDTEKPGKSIQVYRFGLFESPGDYTIFLAGENKYEEGPNASTQLEFEPSDMFFPLPKEQYKGLTRDQVVDSLTADLKAFTKSEKFATSFFAQAKSIKTDFKGEIWSK